MLTVRKMTTFVETLINSVMLITNKRSHLVASYSQPGSGTKLVTTGFPIKIFIEKPIF